LSLRDPDWRVVRQPARLSKGRSEVDRESYATSATYLTQELARIIGSDHDTRALLLHALSTRRKATFEQVNSLNRLRQGLSDAALAYLALTLANLDRASLADEVLGLLVPRQLLLPNAQPIRKS
jgi:hypothetical protein